MDTSTVRLVIFLGMFLIFAGDYSALISTIFGKATDGNATDAAKRPPKVGLEEPHDDISVLLKKNTNKDNVALRRARMIATIKSACLPKLICELSSSVHQDQLSEMELSLLHLIRYKDPRQLEFRLRRKLVHNFSGDTSLSTMAEVPSRYHFAAHMGQLISGVEGQGCHNFYPTCPLARTNVLNMMKKIRLR